MRKEKFIAVALAATMALASGSAMAGGDAAKGAKVFKKCKACHTAQKGGKQESQKDDARTQVHGVLGTLLA